ncbi:MAG: hypothetical protein QJR09_04360 [Micrococcus sp.]|nr:hypothetical protein [Micrococcus sp.]
MIRATVRRCAPALLAAAIIAAASPAAAAPPRDTPAPPTRPDLPLTSVAAGEACDFKLEVSGTGAKARVKTFRNGSQIISGKGFLATYTNVDTGESLTFETKGGAERTSAPDADNVVTVTATGSNGLILFSTDMSEVPGVDAPSAIQYTGRIVYTIDLDTGLFTLVSASGRQRDLCAELS